MAAHRQNRPWTGGTSPRRRPHAPRTTRSATSAPATRASAARATRATTARSCSTTTIRASGPEAPRDPAAPPAAYRVAPAAGHARVVCFSPRHDLTLAEMSPAAIGDVVGSLAEQTAISAAARESSTCSASRTRARSSASPTRTRTARSTPPTSCGRRSRSSSRASARHRAETGRGLLDRRDPRRAADDGRRIIHEDDHAIAFVPYFARYAYEVYVAPKRRVPNVLRADDGEAERAGAALSAVTGPVRQPVARCRSRT